MAQVCCVRNPFAKSVDLPEDPLSSRRPDERPGVSISSLWRSSGVRTKSFFGRRVRMVRASFVRGSDHWTGSRREIRPFGAHFSRSTQGAHAPACGGPLPAGVSSPHNSLYPGVAGLGPLSANPAPPLRHAFCGSKACGFRITPMTAGGSPAGASRPLNPVTEVHTTGAAFQVGGVPATSPTPAQPACGGQAT